MALPDLQAFAVPLYTIGVALLVAVALFGLTKKGARRWLNVGVVIQPSEIMKIGMPLMLAWWFQKREGQLRPLDFLAATVLLVMPVGLIAKQPDLGTAILVMSAGVYVLYFAGLGWKWIIPPLVLGLLAAVLLVVLFLQLFLAAVVGVALAGCYCGSSGAACALFALSYAEIDTLVTLWATD